MLSILVAMLLLTLVGIGAVLAYPPFAAIRIVSRLVTSAIWYGDASRPEVALTFDDGPDPRNTPRVLEILRANGIKATFFIIGSNAARHPALVERIRTDGHQLANHFREDRSIVGWSQAELADSLEATEALLRQETSPRYLRPPGGRYGPGLVDWARKNNYRIVLGSVYPHDPHGVPIWYIRGMVCSLMRPGSIIVLHDGGGDRSATIAALPGILICARQRGLRFVRLAELGASRD